MTKTLAGILIRTGYTLAICAAALVATPARSESAHWEGVEVWYVDPTVYPVAVVSPDDGWSASHAFMADWLGIGVEAWARATRPEGSTTTTQAAVAYDIQYRVEWFVAGSGGDPGPCDVYSEAAARAYAFAGPSELLMSGGGDFGAVALTGQYELDATTHGHVSPYTHAPPTVFLQQSVAAPGSATCIVRIHPTAGVTRPGDYKSYGKVTWIAALGPSTPPPDPQ